jgi:hypothetical protein
MRDGVTFRISIDLMQPLASLGYLALQSEAPAI